MIELQALLSKGAGTLDMVFELASIYKRNGREQPFYDLTRQVLDNTNVPAQAYLRVAEMYTSCKPQRLDLIEEVFYKFLNREPSTPRVWIELACIQLAGGKKDNALKSLRKSISIGGEPIKGIIRKDGRLAQFADTKEFQELTAPSQRPLMPFPRSFIP